MHKTSKWIKKKVLWRFTMSYFLVLILPMLFLWSSTNRLFLENLTVQLVDKHQVTLDKNTKNINDMANEFHSIVNALYPNSFLLSSNMQDNFAAYIDIEQMLFSIQQTHANIDKVYYFNTTCPSLVYSGDGTISMRNFFQYVDQENSSLSYVDSFLPTVTEGAWVSKKQMRSFYLYMQPSLQYIIPVPLVENGYIIFSVAEREFQTFATELGNSYFFDKNETYLVGFEQENIPFTIKANQGLADIVCDNDDYILLSSQDQTGVILVDIIEKNKLLWDLESFQRETLYIVFAVLLFGGAFTYYMIAYSYKPISTLNQFAKSYYNNQMPPNLSEIEQTRYILGEMIEKGNRLYAENGLAQCMLGIVYDEFDHNTEIVAQAKKVGMDFTSPYWRCAIFIGNQELQINDILAQFQKEFTTYGSRYPDNHALLLFIGSNLEDAPQIRAKIETILEKVPSCKHLYVGTPCDNAGELSRSYTHAYSLTGVENTERVLFYREALTQNIVAVYPRKELEQLSRSIVNADATNIEINFHAVMHSAQQQKSNAYVFTSICMECVETFYQACAEIKLSLPEHLTKGKGKEDKTISHRDEFVTLLNELFEQVLLSLNKVEAIQANPIRDYIDSHCDSPDLFVGTVAQYFGMSISNLSHQFKMQTGETISNYILQVKIGYAKKLLIENNLTVEEIARTIGYGHASSFIRQFKEKEGLTPNRFRELNK